MKSISLLLTTALIALVTGTTLPPDLPDGVYSSHIDEHGVEHHVQLSGSSSSSGFHPLSWTHDPANTNMSSTPAPFDVSADTLEKRNCAADPSTAGQMYCGCPYELDHPSCDAAVADLKAQVGNGVLITAGQAYYSIRGISIAYACSYTQYGAPRSLVTATQISTGLAHITNRCGLYITGTYASKYDNNPAGFDVGYMRNYAGLSQHICDAATNWSQNCC